MHAGDEPRAKFKLCCIANTIQFKYEPQRKEIMRLILLIILILLVIGALPTWPYSTGWGYYPSGGLGLLLVIVLLIVLLR
jgi:polyferredoxin